MLLSRQNGFTAEPRLALAVLQTSEGRHVQLP